MIPAEECQIVEALPTQHSVREICEVLGFTRSNFYYQPKRDTSENDLRAEIEKLAAAYPTYGYRRVARLMKSENLSVAIKRACQMTHSTDALRPWINHLKCSAYAYLDHNFAKLR